MPAAKEELEHLSDDGATASSESHQFLLANQRVISIITQHAADLGISKADMLEHIRISPVYWNAFVRGVRDMEVLGHDIVRAIASFLGISPLRAMLLIGKLKPEDLVTADELEQLNEKIYNLLRSDIEVADLLNFDFQAWNALPLNVRLLIGTLHASANKANLGDLMKEALSEAEATASKARPKKSGGKGAARSSPSPSSKH